MWNCHRTITSPVNIETMMSAKHRTRRGPMLSRSRFISVRTCSRLSPVITHDPNEFSLERRRRCWSCGLLGQHGMQCVGISFGDRLVVRSGNRRRARNYLTPSRFPRLVPPGIDFPHQRWNFKVLHLSARLFTMSRDEFCVFAKQELNEFDRLGAVNRKAGYPQSIASQGSDARALQQGRWSLRPDRGTVCLARKSHTRWHG